MGHKRDMEKIGIIDEDLLLSIDESLKIQDNFIKNEDKVYNHIHSELKNYTDLTVQKLKDILGKPYFDVESDYICFTNPLPDGHCLSFETNSSFDYFGSVELYG